MKIAAVFVVLLAGIISIAAARQAGLGPFSTSLPMSLPAPHGLRQAVGPRHIGLPNGAWTHQRTIRFSAAHLSGARMRLQIELAKNGAAAANQPNATGRGRAGRLSVTMHHLGEGSYRWWARYFNGSAISPWVPYSGGTALHVDATPPTAPAITSSTDPLQGRVYRSGTVALAWSSTDSGAGVSLYRYGFGPPGQASTLVTRSTSLSRSGLSTGNYELRVAAKDHAGNWGPASTYRIRLDSTAPVICSTCYGFSSFAFNPNYNSQTFNYRVSRPATIRIGIYGQSGNRVRLVVRHSTAPNQLLHYTWHGRGDNGKLAAPGFYSYVVRVIDSFGNSNLYTYSNLRVLDRVIIISLTQQRLWAYQNGRALMTSLVTTGNVNCCATPPGLYTILASYHPFTFRSPFKPGQYYYYPPSPVKYALLFQDRGFYIHDAPWRSTYGPGTNTVPGVPGSIDTGSHGCVNTPLGMATFLYNWAPVGTPVKVLR